jgi:hypothetical protein
MRVTPTLAAVLAAVLLLPACGERAPGPASITRAGFIQDSSLDEASGMQSGALNPGVYFVHNDDGQPVVYAMDGGGRDLGRFRVNGARNRDWEDITRAPSAYGPLLVIGDIGDNSALRASVTLYLLREPGPGPNRRYAGAVDLLHKIELVYPDGARDCESLAYDPATGDLLLVSKRDRPPRIYRIPLAIALARPRAELEFAGQTVGFRPPTSRDLLKFGARDGPWIAQPTGFDIRPDGRQAAFISYRSIYVFDRAAGEDWPSALARPPREFEGPPERKEEAISYSPAGDLLAVTGEGVPAPVYRVTLRPDQ